MAEILTEEELNEMFRKRFGCKTVDYDAESDSDASDLFDLDLNPEQIDEARQAFKVFDKDNDGTISRNELGTVMRSMGLSPTGDEVEELLKQADVDGDGEIDLKEFIVLMAGQFKESATEKTMSDALSILDPTGKGYVSAADLQRLLTTRGETMSADEAREFIRAVDKDSNGQIDCKAITDLLMGN